MKQNETNAMQRNEAKHETKGNMKPIAEGSGENGRDVARIEMIWVAQQ